MIGWISSGGTGFPVSPLTSGVPCEDPSDGVEIGTGIRGLEISVGERSLIDSVENVTRRISVAFPVTSSSRAVVKSVPVGSILEVDR
jgi:hypothetical protein